jgi:N-acetylglutamate synthase/N-acetylornithine aminotransferase
MAGHPFLVDLHIEGLQLVSAGSDVPLSDEEWRRLEELVKAPEVEFNLTVPGSGGEAEVYFSDLSTGFVEFNSHYTS